MTRTTRALRFDVLQAALAIVLAFTAGIAWLGQPLRMVRLLTIIGLSMVAGVSWARVVWRARR